MPTDDETRLLETCLGPLVMRLQRAQSAYVYYRDTGMTFRGALVLWRANTDLTRHLLDSAWLLPGHLQTQAARIVSHIDVWASLWEYHRDAQRPDLDDKFVFPNDQRFPADAEVALKTYFARLQSLG